MDRMVRSQTNQMIQEIQTSQEQGKVKPKPIRKNQEPEKERIVKNQVNQKSQAIQAIQDPRKTKPEPIQKNRELEKEQIVKNQANQISQTIQAIQTIQNPRKVKQGPTQEMQAPWNLEKKENQSPIRLPRKQEQTQIVRRWMIQLPDPKQNRPEQTHPVQRPEKAQKIKNLKLIQMDNRRRPRNRNTTQTNLIQLPQHQQRVQTKKTAKKRPSPIQGKLPAELIRLPPNSHPLIFLPRHLSPAAKSD